MSAADIVKPPQPALDQRAYEPSMEEILASIRRIIADDQALPGRASGDTLDLRAALDSVPEARDARQEMAPVAARVEPRGSDGPATPRSLARETLPAASATTAESETPRPRVVPAAAHGHIAAPQFAMPDMPTLRGVAQPKRGNETEISLLRFAAPVPPKAEAPPKGESQHSGDADRAPTSRMPEAPPVQSPVAAPPASSAGDAGLVSSKTDQALSAAFNTLAAARIVENDAALRDLAREVIRPMLKTWLDDNLPGMVERLVRAEIERVARGGR